VGVAVDGHCATRKRCTHTHRRCCSIPRAGKEADDLRVGEVGVEVAQKENLLATANARATTSTQARNIHSA
jgi:hypothetical protein